LGQDAGFALKGSQQLCAADYYLLQCHAITQTLIFGLIDGSHAALPYLAYDQITVL
jgi:hypothetical protein